MNQHTILYFTHLVNNSNNKKTVKKSRQVSFKKLDWTPGINGILQSLTEETITEKFIQNG